MQISDKRNKSSTKRTHSGNVTSKGTHDLPARVETSSIPRYPICSLRMRSLRMCSLIYLRRWRRRACDVGLPGALLCLLMCVCVCVCVCVYLLFCL